MWTPKGFVCEMVIFTILVSVRPKTKGKVRPGAVVGGGVGVSRLLVGTLGPTSFVLCPCAKQQKVTREMQPLHPPVSCLHSQ